MSHCYLEDAGLYRATLEQMMYGTVEPETEQQFNDSVLAKKSRKVGDLVKKFDKNLKLEDTAVEEEKEEDKKAETAKPRSVTKAEGLSKVIPTRTKSGQELSMERFVAGILRTSSPLPPAEDETPEVKTEELVETPIMAYRPAKLGVNTPDSAYNSPCSTGSPGSSSATSTPSSTSAPVQDFAPQELDVYLKLARAQLHKTIKQYSSWDPETLQIIAETAASRRQQALLRIPDPCQITQTMLQVYEKCTSGHTTMEMDTIIVSIVHLLEERVHQPQISVLEEYLVMKFNKKSMQ